MSQPDGLPYNAERVITTLGHRNAELTVEVAKLCDVIATLVAERDSTNAGDTTPS